MERVVREALGGSDTEAESGRGNRRHYAKSRGSSAPGGGDGGGVMAKGLLRVRSCVFGNRGAIIAGE